MVKFGRSSSKDKKGWDQHAVFMRRPVIFLRTASPRFKVLLLITGVLSFKFLSFFSTSSPFHYEAGSMLIQQSRATHPPIEHEHVLDCTKQQQTLLNPGLDVHVHNPGIAPPFEMNVHPGDDLLSKRMRTTGCWECWVLQKAMNFLAESPPETIFMDLGTNIGMYSLHAAAMGREVYSFEPLKNNYERFCRSIQLNSGFEQQITLFNVARHVMQSIAYCN